LTSRGAWRVRAGRTISAPIRQCFAQPQTGDPGWCAPCSGVRARALSRPRDFGTTRAPGNRSRGTKNSAQFARYERGSCGDLSPHTRRTVKLKRTEHSPNNPASEATTSFGRFAYTAINTNVRPFSPRRVRVGTPPSLVTARIPIARMLHAAPATRVKSQVTVANPPSP
jgi:hypothetical protein